MSTARQIDLTGGESVYCINTFQMEKAQEVYEQAIEVDPDFLENAVNLAEYVFLAQDNHYTACTILRDVETRAADPDVMARWPLYNTLALDRALGLIEDHSCP